MCHPPRCLAAAHMAPAWDPEAAVISLLCRSVTASPGAGSGGRGRFRLLRWMDYVLFAVGGRRESGMIRTIRAPLNSVTTGEWGGVGVGEKVRPGRRKESVPNASARGVLIQAWEQTWVPEPRWMVSLLRGRTDSWPWRQAASPRGASHSLCSAARQLPGEHARAGRGLCAEAPAVPGRELQREEARRLSFLTWGPRAAPAGPTPGAHLLSQSVSRGGMSRGGGRDKTAPRGAGASHTRGASALWGPGMVLLCTL